jgi:hypothetical protein
VVNSLCNAGKRDRRLQRRTWFRAHQSGGLGLCDFAGSAMMTPVLAMRQLLKFLMSNKLNLNYYCFTFFFRQLQKNPTEDSDSPAISRFSRFLQIFVGMKPLPQTMPVPLWNYLPRCKRAKLRTKLTLSGPSDPKSTDMKAGRKACAALSNAGSRESPRHDSRTRMYKYSRKRNTRPRFKWDTRALLA